MKLSWGWIRQTQQLSTGASTLINGWWPSFSLQPHPTLSVLVDLYILAILKQLAVLHTSCTFPPHTVYTSSLLVWYIHLSSKFQLRHLSPEALPWPHVTKWITFFWNFYIFCCYLVALITMFPNLFDYGPSFFLERRTEKRKGSLCAFKIFLNCQNHFFFKK